jgi:hypothetical protein
VIPLWIVFAVFWGLALVAWVLSGGLLRDEDEDTLLRPQLPEAESEVEEQS